MKKIFSLLTICALVLALSLCALAADKTVYVCDGGTGDGSSAEAPLGSLSAAVSALNGKGGTIVLVGDATHSGLTIPEQTGNLTITSINGATMLIKGRTSLGKNVNDNVFYFDMPVDVIVNSAASFEGRFNTVVFTENFSSSASGGAKASFSYYGGVIQPTTNEDAMTEIPYSITVNAGTFSRFEGGNTRASASIVGAIAAPLTVTINGGTFGEEGEYDAIAPNKDFNGFNFAGMNVLADGGTFTINGGTFNAPVYVAGHYGQTGQGGTKNSTLTMSDKKYYAIDGDINVVINGGTFLGGGVAATYVEAGYTQLVRSNYTVTVNGGTFVEGTVFDATQVKAYAGETKKATLTVAEGVENITAQRFDVVNGEEVEYTEPLRVAFIGDSITEGHSASSRMMTSYPARYLENALAAGEDVIVCNFGISSAGVRPMAPFYTPDMLSTVISLYECDADVYVFAIGVNDAEYCGRSNGALAEYYNRYKALIEEHAARPDTDRIYVSSIVPFTSSTPEKRLRAYALTRGAQKLLVEELNEKTPGKFVFLDLYSLLYDDIAVDSAAFLKDGIHPNDYGYSIYGKAIYNALSNGICEKENFYMDDVYVSNSGKRMATGTKNDPFSYLEFAIAKCSDNATIHILDSVTFDGNFHTPIGAEKLTIVGETEDAVFNFTTAGTILIAGSDLKLDNLFMAQTERGDASDLTIYGNFHNIEITETFTNTGTLRFCAGYIARAERSEVDLLVDVYFDTEETLSASNDVTVTLNGGNYTVFLGGNRRFADNAPYGTYSGNMTLNIGEGVTVNEPTVSALNGANYLTGTITANINGWGAAPLRENTTERLPSDKFDVAKTGGTIIMNVADGIEAERIVTGDFNGDGTFSFVDAITALKCVLNGTNGNATTHFYNYKTISLRHVVHLLKQSVK